MAQPPWLGHQFVVANPNQVRSPSLLIYRAAVQRNIDRVLAIAGGPDRVRPHIKTHKSREVLALQRAAGFSKFKCATLAEAELLAGEGVADVMLAYQMVGPNVGRVVELSQSYQQTRFGVLIDHPAPLGQLGAAATAAGVTVAAFMDLDVGQGRTGVAPEVAAELYRQIAATDGVEAAGVQIYDGHNHQRDLAERQQAVDRCYATMASVRDELAVDGVDIPEVVAGGSPTFPCYAKYDDVVLSPGTVFLNDGGYQTSFPDLPFEIGAALLSRVVSTPLADSFTLDLGTKAIATDPAVRGSIVGLGDDVEPLTHNEEHWRFRLLDSAIPRPEVGDSMYVVPTHICPTVNLQTELQIVGSSGRIEDSWTVDAHHRI